MIYVTVPGDTVSSISRQSGVPVWKIIYDNQLGEEGKLTVGQALLLLKPQESAEIREDLYVTGYAYPFIEPYVLEMAFRCFYDLCDSTGRYCIFDLPSKWGSRLEDYL